MKRKLIKVLEKSYSLDEADHIFNLIMDDEVSEEKTIEYIDKVCKYSKYDDLEDYFYDGDNVNILIDNDCTILKNHDAEDKRFMLKKYNYNKIKYYDYDIPVEMSLFDQIELVNKLLEIL